MTIPSPTVLHFRGGRQAIEQDGLSRDGAVLRRPRPRPTARRCAAFYEAGCRYLQLDDTVVGLSLRRASCERRASAATIPTRCRDIYADVINAALKDRPPTCRSPCISAAATSARPGSRRAATSRWPSMLFSEMQLDAYFLEYDTERAGGFEPLRFLPKGKKQVVLGLMTSKTGALESKDQIKRRIDEAAKFVAARPALPARRNAASPRPRRATCWPRTSSGPSCG